MKKIDKIDKLVLRLPNWIGDAVMAIPTVMHIKTSLPHTHITAVAQPQILELYEGLGCFDNVIPVLKKDPKKVLIEALSKTKADCGLLLTNSFSSAWQFIKARIPIRIGFSCHFRGLLLTHSIPFPYDETLHDVLRYHQLILPLNITPLPEKELELQLHITEEEKRHMRERLEASGLHPWHKILLINPGAAYGEAKCWPKDYFKEVLKQIKDIPDLYTVLIGSQQVADLTEELAALLPEKILSLAGKTTLREVMTLISLSNAIITNDSGPMHIAAALKTPLIALFGSTNPLRTGPWKWGHILYEKADCSPCYLRKCTSDFRCMKQITPQKVLNEFLKL
jgi:heptosyltransferase-2